MTTTAHVYIVDNDLVWQHLNAVASADWVPGSPGESLYLNAVIADAATTHLAADDERQARLQSLAAHVEATGDMSGLHGSFLALTNAAVMRGDGAAVSAAAATWQKFGAPQVPRAIAGAVPIYDAGSQALLLADASRVAGLLPPLPSGPTDTAGMVNFLNGIDRRIHDAFGDPQSSNAAFDAATANVVSGLNEAAVTIAQIAAIGVLVPGGQAIAGILLVGAGVLAVGAAAVSLFGSLVDLFTSTEPTRIDLPDAVVPPNPYELGDPPPTATPDPPTPPDPTSTDATSTDTNSTGTTSTDTTTDTTTTDTTTTDTTTDSTTDTTDVSTTSSSSNDIPDTRDTGEQSDTSSQNGEQAGGEQAGGGGGEGTGGDAGGGAAGEPVHGPWRVQDAEGDQDDGER